MHGIILAQIDQLSHLPKDVNYEEVIGLEASMCKRIFDMSKSVTDFDKPLTPKILSNSNHDFVKLLLYIYSM